MPIIDVHAHWGPWPYHRDDAANAANAESAESADTNLRLMDRYGIDVQIVSAAEAVTYDAVAETRRWHGCWGTIRPTTPGCTATRW